MKYTLPLRRMVSILPVVLTLLSILLVTKFSAYGIDLTDESFYLVWMANPFLYEFSVTQFGFIYHPFYSFLNGNIFLLKLINTLFIFSLTWLLVYRVLRLFVFDASVQRIAVHVMAAGFACCGFLSLTFFAHWLPTPSYNTLAFQALLLVAIGLLWANRTTSLASIIGWITVGAAGWLAFMAKPSTALALSPCVLCYIIAARKFNTKMLLLAIVSAAVLLVTSALWIDGSVTGFVERIKGGMRLASLFENGRTLREIFRIDLPFWVQVVVLAVLLISLIYFSLKWKTPFIIKIRNMTAGRWSLVCLFLMKSHSWFRGNCMRPGRRCLPGFVPCRSP